MKQNIIMIAILIALFLFGLLIYDFSDQLDTDIADSNWYTVRDDRMTVLSFSDNIFHFYDKENQEQLHDFRSCLTFRYNSNINVIRLNCPIRANKIHVANVTEYSLTLLIDGENIDFFSTSEAAKHAHFKIANDITEFEFINLMDFDLNNFRSITVDEFDSLLRGRNTDEHVAFVNANQSIQNALNLAALMNFRNSVPNLSIIIVDDLTPEELLRLNQIVDLPDSIEYFNNNRIPVYSIINREIGLVITIEVNSFSEINNFNNI